MLHCFAITEQSMKRVDFIEILYSFLCLENIETFSQLLKS